MVVVDETAVAESEGKRSSMGQMVLAGWARESVPARLYKRRLQCCAPWNRPARHRINCRGLYIEGAVRADTSYLSVLIGPLPAPVFLPKAAGNHVSGTVGIRCWK